MSNKCPVKSWELLLTHSYVVRTFIKQVFPYGALVRLLSFSLKISLYLNSIQGCFVVSNIAINYGNPCK